MQLNRFPEPDPEATGPANTTDTIHPLTAVARRRPDRAWRVNNLDEATLMLDHLSREVGRRKTAPGSATVSLQRREQLPARARKTATAIKARP